MAASHKESTSSTWVDTIGKYVAIIAALASIIGTVWAIYADQSPSVQININAIPSAVIVSESPVIYQRLEDFEDDDACLAYAADLLGQNKHQAAETFLSDFLKTVEPGSQLAIAIHYDRGLAHLYLGEYNQAIKDFDAVIDQVDYPDAYYNRGNALLSLDHYDQALKEYEHAIELEEKPEYVYARDAVRALMDSENALLG